MHGLIPHSCIVLTEREYDILNKPLLLQQLAQLQPGCNATVDFRNVRYFDASCVGALAGTLKRLRASDPASTIVLAGLASGMRRVFDLTRLGQIFEITENSGCADSTY